MATDALAILQIAVEMAAVVCSLFVLVLLLLFLPFLIYAKWLIHYGRAEEGTITSRTVEKRKRIRYEVNWVDPQTQQLRISIVRYSMAPEREKGVGEKVTVYVHPTFSRLSTVQVQTFSSLLWKAWQEGELLRYLDETLRIAVWNGLIGMAVLFILAVVTVFTNGRVGLGLLLGGFLIGFIGTWIAALIIRR